MSILNARKTVTPGVLDCGGRARVTISFDVEAGLREIPADMVLVMDRSGSMYGPPMAAAQMAARELIQIVARASGDPEGRTLLNGSRMGIVSFAGEASRDTQLETGTRTLFGAIDSLKAKGETNHEKAFLAAQRLLKDSESPRKIIILFTDGVSNAGNADPAAERIKAEGIEIFCIGLLRDPCNLKRWASDPVRTHAASTCDPGSLCRIFREIGSQAVKTGLQDVKIMETLTEDFRIEHIDKLSHGTVQVLNDRTLYWKIGTVCDSGTVRLIFTVRHVGLRDGEIPVNESIRYQDRDCNQVCFPSPTVEITCCDPGIVVDPCPDPDSARTDPCQDLAEINADGLIISGQGRIVRVNAVLKNVCPGKRAAVAVVLTEVDCRGQEHSRGMKTVLIPAQPGEGCRDVQLRCIQFVVPEELDACGCPQSMCDGRDFRVRLFANYVDTDFRCCDPETVIL